MALNNKTLIKLYQEALQAAATEKAKQWWEKYMKGVIPFRGVGIPVNRELLAQWRIDNALDELPLERQLDLALDFLSEPIAEDKLAGIIYLQLYLCEQLPWKKLLARFEIIYKKQLIFDWNICDWFCIRVLGAMIKKSGIKCAEAIANWRDAGYLWQARSSLVPFVYLASESLYYPLIREAGSVLINREERFAKTAVGWVLREVSAYDEKLVTGFVESHLESFSRESLKNALKHFPKEKKQFYLQKLKKK